LDYEEFMHMMPREERRKMGSTTATKRRFYLYFIKGVTTCAICGKPVKWRDATLEHLTPKSKGGTLDFNNISISHRKCNQKRGTNPLGILK